MPMMMMILTTMTICLFKHRQYIALFQAPFMLMTMPMMMMLTTMTICLSKHRPYCPFVFHPFQIVPPHPDSSLCASGRGLLLITSRLLLRSRFICIHPLDSPRQSQETRGTVRQNCALCCSSPPGRDGDILFIQSCVTCAA